eukprot:5177364-Pyramimonas_sp.AAC.1
MVARCTANRLCKRQTYSARAHGVLHDLLYVPTAKVCTGAFIQIATRRKMAIEDMLRDASDSAA